MRDKIKLNDIADDLLILNKYTIDELFKIDNPTNCIALYLFYYKTAKWQKTDTIKATDLYVKKSLNWGIDKVKRTKQLLKEHGLIDVVQRRNNGKIEGWYVKVSYLVSRKKIEDIKVQVDESKNTCELQLGFSTSGSQDTNALKQQLNALKLENEMLKKQIKENNKKKVNNKIYNQIQNLYNEICTSLPKCTKITEQRKQMIDARLKDYTVEDFEKVFKLAQASDFLSGRNGKWNSCNFDWLIRPNNFVKVIEGTYNKNNKKIEKGFLSG